MSELINEIMNNVQKKVHAHYMNSPEKPNVVIFMTDDVRHSILKETCGYVETQYEVDFNKVDGYELCGYPVNIIISRCIKPYFVFIDNEG